MLILDVITTESRQRLEENALDRLLQGVAGGDRDALAELYGRARTAVYALALSYLKNPTEAEDVTQDTFVQIWEKAPAYRSEGKALACPQSGTDAAAQAAACRRPHRRRVDGSA